MIFVGIIEKNVYSSQYHNFAPPFLFNKTLRGTSVLFFPHNAMREGDNQRTVTTYQHTYFIKQFVELTFSIYEIEVESLEVSVFFLRK